MTLTPTECAKALRDFAEMPLEGSSSDPLIDVFSALASDAADIIDRMSAALREARGFAEAEQSARYQAIVDDAYSRAPTELITTIDGALHGVRHEPREALRQRRSAPLRVPESEE